MIMVLSEEKFKKLNENPEDGSLLECVHEDHYRSAKGGGVG